LLARLEINGIDEDAGINEEILHVIHDAGINGISSRDIARKYRTFRRLDAMQKLEILTKLLADGQIIEKKEGQAVKYFISLVKKTSCTSKQN